VLGVLLLCASGIGPAWMARSSRSAAASVDPTDANVGLEVSSTPTDASLVLDDQPRGSLLRVVALAPGVHTVTVQAPDAIPEARQVELTSAGDAFPASAGLPLMLA